MDWDEENVIDAAEQRALALASADVEELRRLMHPKLQWTTHRGDVLDRDTYLAGNTDGSLSGMSSALKHLPSRLWAMRRCSLRLSWT